MGFSLHAQGWPVQWDRDDDTEAVLPARAGMARTECALTYVPLSSPCTRRDGPVPACSSISMPLFSLHAQGWPYYPTE